MLADLRAAPHLEGPSVAVDLTWRDEGERPDLRLVRRSWTYPETSGDGRAVFDVGERFAADGTPWARVTRVRCVLTNSGAEGGLLEAELVLWFGPDDDSVPARARVAWYSVSAGELREETVEPLAGVDHVINGDEETLVLRVDDGTSSLEIGRLELAVGPTDGLFTWRPSQGRTREIAFHRCEVEHTIAEVTELELRRLRAAWSTWAEHDATPLATALAGGQVPAGPNGREQLRFHTTLDEVLDEDSGDWRRRLSVTDAGVTAHRFAYYRLFVRETEGDHTERGWRTSALPTPHYGYEDVLYRLLPRVHQRLDEPGGGGRGQLRRFLSVFGSGLDQVRGHAEALGARHDLLAANPEQLEHLSRWIGWEPDRTAPVRRQRSDIRFAPAVYDTVGTVDNLRAVIKRAVGWESETKEFVNNVLLTNAPEPVHTWELWGASLGASGELASPEPIADATAFDGRPAAAVDGDGELWLFWESDRGGRRSIWLRGPGHPDAPAVDAGDGVVADVVDEHPAVALDGQGRVWLFWSSDRAGSRHIWRQRFPADGLGPEMVTSHAAAGACPAVAADDADGLWLFWQSDRRGPTDIWCRRLRADGSMGEERRVTTARGRHEMPAAATDADGRLWLFWVADEVGGRSLWARTRDGGEWSVPERLHAGGWRHEAPCAVLRQDELWLLWHTDQDGSWNLWASHLDGTQWTDPVPVTEHVEADKEPTVVAAGNELRVWWRSQRRGAGRRSRTVDTTDAAALAAMGTLADRTHYTYDTGRDPEDWYARDTVGIALTPTGDVFDPEAALERIADYVEPFRPLPVRLVWLSIPARHEDFIDTRDLIEEEYEDAID